MRVIRKKTDSEFSTGICYEQPRNDNPFVAESRYIKGYDSQDLWLKSSYIDVMLLHFIKELPTPEYRRAVEMLFICLMNLGPREVGNRTAMVSGISKTRPEHLLPIGLLSCQGETNDVELAYTFIRKHLKESPGNCLVSCLEGSSDSNYIAPGFGRSYGSIDPILQRLAKDISNEIPQSEIFNWSLKFTALLGAHNQGWLASGLTAAVCLALDIGAVPAKGLYQIAKSVGIVAYGFEQARKPMSRAPMLSDEQYECTSRS